ncbi:MAG: YciI family protein, partial [Owenweeksia sp.]
TIKLKIMTKFLYLFRGGDARRAQQSPEEMQAHMQKWGAWMNNLAEQGTLVDGLPLGNEGKVVSSDGKTITDGPFAEGAEIVGGYLIVNAENLSDATRTSLGCPIFEHEGTVEVREIMGMDI